MKSLPSSLKNLLPILINLACVVLLFSHVTGAAGQSGSRQTFRRPPALPAGQSTVRGRVIYKDNSEPLKGVRLRIVSAGENQGELFAFANDRGEFRIDNLGAGKYYVMLEGPGVAMPSGMGVRIPLPMTATPRKEDFEPIVPRHDGEFTVDGSTNAGIEIRVDRGGKLSGKILKANGSPAANVPVMIALRATTGPYRSRFSTRTDKDGVYKFENLPPGDYVVGASEDTATTQTDMRARMRGETQQITYHPATVSMRDADTIHLDSGGQVSGVNITLITRQSFAISGRVIRQQDGTPLADVTVLLRSKDAESSLALLPGVAQRTTRTDSEGRWSFSNINEGSYTVSALAPMTHGGDEDGPTPANRRERPRFLVSQQDLIIAGNLNELLLPIIGPGSVRGTVELENGQALPTDLVLHLEFVREGGRPGPPVAVRVQPDGTFNLDEIQGGDIYLYASAASGRDSVFVKSVTAEGKDLASSPLHVIEGATVGPVRIVISNNPGRVSGRVIAEQKDSLADVFVVIVPTDPARQRFRTTYFTSRVSAEGNYALAAPPGDYLIFVRNQDSLPPIISSEFIQKELDSSERVSLGAGENKRLDLHLR